MGLTINEAETKFMEETTNLTNTHGRNYESDKYTKCLKAGNYTFEKVYEFKYLGTLISSNNNLSTEIHNRLQIANSCYLGLRNQLWSQ